MGQLSVIVLLILVPVAALALLFLRAVAGRSRKISKKNARRAASVIEQLKGLTAPDAETMAAVERTLEEIRQANGDDYDIMRAVADHWYRTVTDGQYRMYYWQGEEKADALLEVGPEFGKRHAFVVPGYTLKDGKMSDELKDRCGAAAAAARAFPDTVLVCTGGATGSDNPGGVTEAGEMKKYLTETCGIEAGRIITETKARYTVENAVNTVRILLEQEIDTMTVVTSDYHQIGAQNLFNAAAAIGEKQTGHRIRIVGNYNCREQPADPKTAWSPYPGGVANILGVDLL